MFKCAKAVNVVLSLDIRWQSEFLLLIDSPSKLYLSQEESILDKEHVSTLTVFMDEAGTEFLAN